jgi:Bifunctional DNA primase/polymerase, N-terminal
MIEHAIKWVDRGFAVFPCLPRDKTPEWRLVPRDKGPDGVPIEGTGGCKKSTRDKTLIREWWSKCPKSNIGVATGDGSFVVDLDGSEAQHWFVNSCGRHGAADPTLTVKTARGWHLYFWAACEVPCSGSRIAPHVDVRGTGGYVIGAPSIHPDGHAYKIVRDLPVAEAPRWLTDLALPDPVPERPPMPPLAQMGEGAQIRALAGIIRIVATASEGQRNRITFWAACRLGEMVRDGLISAGRAEDILIQAAASAGISHKEARRTANSGFKRRGQR